MSYPFSPSAYLILTAQGGQRLKRRIAAAIDYKAASCEEITKYRKEV